MLMNIRLFVVALRCMGLVCKDKTLLRKVAELHNRQQVVPFFQEMVEKSLVHCQVQRGYDSGDLEVSGYFIPFNFRLSLIFAPLNFRPPGPNISYFTPLIRPFQTDKHCNTKFPNSLPFHLFRSPQF